MVLGAGKGVLYALRDAHLKVPTMDFGDVAIIYNSESIAPKRAMSLSLVGNREKGELGV